VLESDALKGQALTGGGLSRTCGHGATGPPSRSLPMRSRWGACVGACPVLACVECAQLAPLPLRLPPQ